jgi:hypothetical protein
MLMIERQEAAQLFLHFRGMQQQFCSRRGRDNVDGDVRNAVEKGLDGLGLIPASLKHASYSRSCSGKQDEMMVVLMLVYLLLL